jgi:excinuclease UvrABC ATPase subunit
MNKISIKGLLQNNLKHISLFISKHKITVFTGVSSSGKSSIIFDTIAAAEAKMGSMQAPIKEISSSCFTFSFVMRANIYHPTLYNL